MAEPRFAGPMAAAQLLVMLAWAVARPAAPPAPGACQAPQEALSAEGWTVWVSCDPEGPSRPLRGASPLLFGQRLDLNRAPPSVLEVLPGIGPARAAALARERARRPFASLADAERAHGVGPRIVAGLRGWAEARPAPPEAAPRASAGRAYGSQKGHPIASKSKRKQLQRAGQSSPARTARQARPVRDDSPAGGRVRGLASQ